MRSVLLISPQFLPSNLAGVHRVRLMSAELERYGWKPTILTVDPAYYEEACDPALMHLVPEGVAIERTSAWPARLCRPLGIGDIALRAQTALRRRAAQLIRDTQPSVVFVTVLPGYTALVGAWAKRKFRVPFVLDYQDPWLAPGAGVQGWSKAAIANRIARRVEPGVLQEVDAMTAVSEATLDSIRARMSLPQVPIEIVPIGADRRDHDVAAKHGRSMITKASDGVSIAYVGTLTTRMIPALRAFLAALALARSATTKRLELHLIGTSAQAGGNDQHDLSSLVRKAGLHAAVHIHPARVSYLDALRAMQDADLLLLIGSTDAHYTASKLFPYWLSGKPILGLFHRASTVVQLSSELGGVDLVLYDETHPPEATVSTIAERLCCFVNGERRAPPRNEEAFEPYSPSGIALRYAQLFNRVAA